MAESPASLGGLGRPVTQAWMAWLTVLACALAGRAEPPASYPLPPTTDLHYSDAWIAREVLLRLDRDAELV